MSRQTSYIDKRFKRGVCWYDFPHINRVTSHFDFFSICIDRNHWFLIWWLTNYWFFEFDVVVIEFERTMEFILYHFGCFSISSREVNISCCFKNIDWSIFSYFRNDAINIYYVVSNADITRTVSNTSREFAKIFFEFSPKLLPIKSAIDDFKNIACRNSWDIIVIDDELIIKVWFLHTNQHRIGNVWFSVVRVSWFIKSANRVATDFKVTSWTICAKATSLFVCLQMNRFKLKIVSMRVKCPIEMRIIALQTIMCILKNGVISNRYIFHFESTIVHRNTKQTVTVRNIVFNEDIVTIVDIKTLTVVVACEVVAESDVVVHRTRFRSKTVTRSTRSCMPVFVWHRITDFKSVLIWKLNTRYTVLIQNTVCNLVSFHHAKHASISIITTSFVIKARYTCKICSHTIRNRTKCSTNIKFFHTIVCWCESHTSLIGTSHFNIIHCYMLRITHMDTIYFSMIWEPFHIKGWIKVAITLDAKWKIFHKEIVMIFYEEHCMVTIISIVFIWIPWFTKLYKACCNSCCCKTITEESFYIRQFFVDFNLLEKSILSINWENNSVIFFVIRTSIFYYAFFYISNFFKFFRSNICWISNTSESRSTNFLTKSTSVCTKFVVVKHCTITGNIYHTRNLHRYTSSFLTTLNNDRIIRSPKRCHYCRSIVLIVFCIKSKITSVKIENIIFFIKVYWIIHFWTISCFYSHTRSGINWCCLRFCCCSSSCWCCWSSCRRSSYYWITFCGQYWIGYMVRKNWRCHNCGDHCHTSKTGAHSSRTRLCCLFFHTFS